MTLTEQLKLIMKKARRSLDAAKRNFDAGDYDFASSRAYYAAFYAVEAALVTKELSFSKHSAVISAFNQHFVKTGRFPKEFGKLLARLFRQRQLERAKELQDRARRFALRLINLFFDERFFKMAVGQSAWSFPV